jgi:hypothetical protein
VQKFPAIAALCILCSGHLFASDSTAPLTIEMSDPEVRITVPGMHEIDMEVHPENAEKPAFRLSGSLGMKSVSVTTPRIQGDVSPMNCAISVANVLLAGSPVTREQMFLGRSNEHTFLIIYGVPLDESVLLNTHIVSAAGATRCIEVHVSKISTSDADIEPWFNGFGTSNIETLN